MIAMLRSRLPGWLRRWVTTGGQYETLLTLRQQRLMVAVARARESRERLATTERRLQNARAQAAAAVAAADRYADTVARVSQVLDAWERYAAQYSVGDGIAGQMVMAAQVRRALDGDPEAAQR